MSTFSMISDIPCKTNLNWPWSINDKDIQTFDSSIAWPKISIVTPSFNQGKFIEETIRSVIFQNYPNLEYIIIDGGSTDNTLSIIKKYESYITYWVSEPDRGQSHAINKGIEKCTGEIFNWLNSDDWYLPNTFFNVVAAFIKDPSIQVVSGYEHHIHIDGTVVEDKGTFLEKTLEKTIECCQVTQPSTFFRAEVIKKVGLIPEDIHYIMDGEMWVRFLLLYGQNSVYKHHMPLAYFRLHENSKTVSNGLINNFLFERSSIINDLQRFIEVPVKIRDYWISNVYKTSTFYSLNRSWQINNEVITTKKLRSYFVRKYINLQFQQDNLEDAYWGLKQLVKSFTLNFFVVKGFIKLLVKAILK